MKRALILLCMVLSAFYTFAQANDNRLNYDSVRLTSEIKISNDGIDGEYFVEINGEIHQSIKKLEVISKKTKIRIYQKRLLGEWILLEQLINPVIGTDISFEISVPYLTEAETAYINEKEQFIEHYWQDEQAYYILRDELVKLIKLFSDTDFNPDLRKYKKKYEELLNELEPLILAYELRRKKEAENAGNPVIIDNAEIRIDRDQLEDAIGDLINSKFYFYLGASFSGYWYPIQDTMATKMGGGLDLGFSAKVKQNMGIGYFTNLSLEPSLIQLTFGVTPGLQFDSESVEGLSFSFIPLEMGIRMDYDDELELQYGLTTSFGLDYYNGYFRVSAGGYMDNVFVLRLAAGFKIKLKKRGDEE